MADDKELFLSACSTGDVATVGKLLSGGFRPGTALAEDDMWDMLEGVFTQNSLDMVKCLFPAALDPNLQLAHMLVEEEYLERHVPPTFMALHFSPNDDTDILSYLLNSGADPDGGMPAAEEARDYEVYSLMTYAGSLGKENNVRYLSQRGALGPDILQTIKWACMNVDINILKAAAENNIDFTQEDNHALYWILPCPNLMQRRAIPRANLTCFEHFAEGVTVRGRDRRHINTNFSPDKHLEAVKFLLSCGADPNRSHYDLSPGHMVSRGHKVELYKLLLAHGWDINTDTGGWTALHLATVGNDVNVVKFLVENGCSFTTTAPHASHPILINHCYYAREEPTDPRITADYNAAKIRVLEYMVSVGVDINTRENFTNLVEDMCGIKAMYNTLVWLMKQPIELPFKGDEWMLSETITLGGDCREWIAPVFTDCLMLSGFQPIEFVESHLKTAIMTNNNPEYLAAKHANPMALYNIGLDAVESEIKKLMEYRTKGEESDNSDSSSSTQTTVRIDNDNLIHIMRDADNYDKSVYYTAQSDQQTAPTLLQLSVYAIREHLLRVGPNISVYRLVQKLNIPRTIIDIVSLDAFVKYSTKFGGEY